jgi:hypothetical protein
VAVRVLGGVSHAALDGVDHALAHVVLQLLRLLVHLAPVQLEHAREERLQQPVPPEHERGGALAGAVRLAAPRGPSSTSRSSARCASMFVTLGADTPQPARERRHGHGAGPAELQQRLQVVLARAAHGRARCGFLHEAAIPY